MSPLWDVIGDIHDVISYLIAESVFTLATDNVLFTNLDVMNGLQRQCLWELTGDGPGMVYVFLNGSSSDGSVRVGETTKLLVAA